MIRVVLCLLVLFRITDCQFTCRNGNCFRSANFSYGELCAKNKRARENREDVVMLHWTDPMLDVYHKLLRCTDEKAPDCDTDDDWTATFQRACKNGGVPCLIEDIPPRTNRYSYVETSCRTWGLDFKCTVTDDVADLNPETILSADVIIFQGTNNRVWGQGVYPPYKCEGQIWAMWEFRPSSVYPFLRDEKYLKTFDVTAGYSRNWTIWAPDFVPPSNFYDYISDQKGTAENPVMAMISQCNTPNKRIQYLEELMKHIGVDSYGKCLKNRDMSADILALHNKYAQKSAILKRYKFAIAFENSNELDYVSEKIYNALSEGVVPIYMGAPNVNLYAPTDSYINTANFESPLALATYLKSLLADQTAYDRYLAWKKAKPELHMKQLEKSSISSHLCRICSHAKAARHTVRAAPIHTEL